MHKTEKWTIGSAWAFSRRNVPIFEAGLASKLHLFPPKGRKEAGWGKREGGREEESHSNLDSHGRWCSLEGEGLASLDV